MVVAAWETQTGLPQTFSFGWSLWDMAGGTNRLQGLARMGAAWPSAGSWSLARQHMVAAEGAPGAKDSQEAGSLWQSWGLAGHAALGAGLGIRTPAECLGEEHHSEATKQGS